jgi:hypothetical protein
MRHPKPEDYLTISAAAAYFDYLSPSTLRKAAHEGKLQHVKVGPRAIVTT